MLNIQLIDKKIFLRIISIIFLLTSVIYLYSYIVFQERKEDYKTITNSQIVPTDSIKPYCEGVDFNKVNNLAYTEIKSLNVVVSDSRSWYVNLLQAYEDGGPEYPANIKRKYKNYFTGFIVVEYSNGVNCNFKAEIRISGDWKDHINITDLTSSLDIRLKEGNLSGITGFKLILPESRNGDNEIFITTLLKHYNFLVPRTTYVNVEFNNTGNFKYLFQEKFNKEFLESNNLREAPIVETNEKYFWETSLGEPFKEVDGLFLTLGKVRNLNWAKSNSANETIALEALYRYNTAINKSNLTGFIHRDLDSTGFLSIFDAMVTALNAGHMLADHNRIYYFNKLNENFIPIYYDGNSKFLETDSGVLNIKQNYIDSPSLALGSIKALELIKKNAVDVEKLYLELELKGSSISKNEIIVLLDKLKINLEMFKDKRVTVNNSYPEINKILSILEKNAFEYELVEDWIIEDFKRLNSVNDIGVKLLIKDKFNITNICDQKLKNCTYYDKKNINSNIFLLALPENYQIFGLTTKTSNNSVKELIFDNFEIKVFNNPDVIINDLKKEINIEFSQPNQKVLFVSGGIIEDYKIIISSNKILNSNLDSRSDENLLTGCITFYENIVKNLEITMTSSHCEDSINFISSKGNINFINIKNSFQDSLDIDFSNININKINIENAGNDCLDISGSEIYINEAILSNCSDKAISIGEKTTSEINNVFVDKSSIGLAVKDSSKFTINSAFISQTNICFSAYRKKQEFGPVMLSINNYQCDSELFYIQEGSLVSFGS